MWKDFFIDATNVELLSAPVLTKNLLKMFKIRMKSETFPSIIIVFVNVIEWYKLLLISGLLSCFL